MSLFLSSDPSRLPGLGLGLDPAFDQVQTEEAVSASPPSEERTDLLTWLNALQKENVRESWEMQKELFAMSNEASNAAAVDAWNRYLAADNTKYQRAVKDMRSAGINPIIAFSSGMPSVSTAMSPALTGSQAAVNSANAVGSNAIGQREELIKDYVSIVVGFLNSSISSASNLLGNILPKNLLSSSKVVSGFTG